MTEYVPPDPSHLRVPRAESPFLERELARLALSAEQSDALRHFAEHGYLIVDLDLEDFDGSAERMIRDLGPQYPDFPRRIEEAWYDSDDVRRLASAPAILEWLTVLYGRRPFPFQTINFDSGTEQPAHSDTLHFHCVPRRFMAGVWVALEDMDADNGPLFVHPGSHRLPDFDMFGLGLDAKRNAYQQYEDIVKAMLEERGVPRKELHLKKGQAVIWAANLFHGGTEVRGPGRTRHSQVTHYYFDDCLYYFPMESDPSVGDMVLREVIDIGSGRVMPHTYRGEAVATGDYPVVSSYPEPLPSYVVREAATPPAESGATDNQVRTLRKTVALLRGEVSHLEEQLDNVGHERDTLKSHSATLEHDMRHLRGHIANLERMLSKIHGEAIYRSLGWVKSLFVKKRVEPSSNGELSRVRDRSTQ